MKHCNDNRPFQRAEIPDGIIKRIVDYIVVARFLKIGSLKSGVVADATDVCEKEW